MSTAELIRVAIIEDDQIMREGLGQLIHGTPGFCCVGAFYSAEEALRASLPEQPNVLLLDVHLPGMSGSEGVQALQKKFPGVQVVMLTVHDQEENIFESICNGACGYLLKKTPPARLLEAIREANEGGAPMTPEVARKVVRLFQKTRPVAPTEHGLTPHEVRLLQCLADGYSYQDVAERLGVTINTIRTHISHIYRKLHVHSKTEAVRKALKSHLIT